MIALNHETEQLAKLLAERTGKSPAEIIKQALEDRARSAGISPPPTTRRKPSFERMMQISDRFAAHPVLDGRCADEIVGYDELGVPR